MRTALALCLALCCCLLRAAPDEGESRWMKSFYRMDDIAPFDAFWKKTVDEKLLENENAIAPSVSFVSQVLRRHPELMKGRLDDLANVPGAQLIHYLDILWLSDTKEAREMLRTSGHTEYLGRKPPAIGSTKIEKAADLDFCWGWFFATGDTAALDPIVSALEFGEFAGAAKRYATSKKTEADRIAAYKEAMFGAAMWSLEANGREDVRIVEHLETVFADPKTPQSRGMWLALVLSKLKPETYTVEFAKDAGEGKPAMKIRVAKADTAGAAPNAVSAWAEFDAVLDRVAAHAKYYPPTFADAAERAKIEGELKALLAKLAKALKKRPDEPALLFRDGFANAMGHNLDFRGCADRAIKSYQRLLELQPENGAAHFYYGGFLASTAAHQKTSIVHLRKALELGVTDAHYTLGFALLSQGDKDGALEQFREYSRLNPSDGKAKELIEHINKGEVRIMKTDDAPAKGAK
jgi:tetratricopeptide (TPR) repeat protein